MEKTLQKMKKYDDALFVADSGRAQALVGLLGKNSPFPITNNFL